MRFSLPNSRIMVHQPSGGFQGQATDIMLHAQEILNLKKRLNEIYVKHTGQTYKAIEDALERDKFLTAEMARDFGIVDKVIDKRPEGAGARKPRKVTDTDSPALTLTVGRIGKSGRELRAYAPAWAESSAFVLVWRRGNRATLGRFRQLLLVRTPQITVLSRVARAGPISEFLIVGCDHGWLCGMG